jgi:hypothetical protein
MRRGKLAHTREIPVSRRSRMLTSRTLAVATVIVGLSVAAVSTPASGATTLVGALMLVPDSRATPTAAAQPDASTHRYLAAPITESDLPRLRRVPHSKVGRVTGTRAFIALTFDGQRLRAYVCNGDGKRRPTLATWFKRRWDGRSPIMLAADGLKLRITKVHADGHITGRLRLARGTHRFSVKPAPSPAGLYDGTKGRGRNKLRATRIVLANGSRRGAVAPSRRICRNVLITQPDGTTLAVKRCEYFF